MPYITIHEFNKVFHSHTNTHTPIPSNRKSSAAQKLLLVNNNIIVTIHTAAKQWLETTRYIEYVEQPKAHRSTSCIGQQQGPERKELESLLS